MRTLSTSPVGPSLLAVSSLALGIGVSAAAFSVTDAVLFRPLPVRQPGSLVRLFSTEGRGGSDRSPTALPILRAVRERSHSLTGLSLFREGVLVHVGIPGSRPQPASCSIVSGEFFGLLGATPASGRLLGPADDQIEGAHPVVAISHAFWKSHFADTPQAVGAVLRLNGRPFTVVGVTAPGFSGLRLEQPPDLFVSVAMSGDVEPIMRGQLEYRSSAFFDAVGRLKPGASLQSVQGELDALSHTLGAGAPGTSWPETDDPSWRLPWLRVEPAQDVVGVGSQRLAQLTLLAVALLLLIACANASGVLLARSNRRRHEMALRVALGASRWQLLRESLGDALLLGGAATATSIPVALALLAFLRRSVPDPPPLPIAAATDVLSLRAFALMAGLGVLTGVVASITPALRMSSVDPLETLKGNHLRTAFGRFTAGHVLATLQVAVSMTLLSTSALLLHAAWNIAHVDVGFEPRQLLVASLNLARGGYDVPRALALQARLCDELRALPDVESAAIGIQLPTRASGTTTIEASGRSRTVGFNFVSPGYVDALRLTLLSGRDIGATDNEGSPPVALVNEELVKAFWPGIDPIGQRIRGFGPHQAALEVVGVVRYRAGGVGEAPQPMFLGARSQLYGTFPWQPRTAIYLRVRAGDPHRLAPALARVVESLDPDLPLLGVRTAEEELGLPFAQQRLLIATSAAISGIALSLTFVGVFGVVAAATEARRREIGVRVALGAGPLRVLLLVFGQSGRLVAAGLVVGMPLVIGAGPTLSRFLVGVNPHEPLALGCAAAVLALAALLAACGPARRALEQDLTRSLRAD